MGEHPSDEPGDASLRRGAHPEVVGGLEEHLAAALAYLLWFVTGLFFLVVEDDNDFVRFHAAQSTLLFGGLFLVTFTLTILMPVFTIIPVFGWFFAVFMSVLWTFLGGLAVVLWLVLVYKAYSGERYHLPLIGQIAENYA